ncbi:MAG: hypothetical protein QNJ46_13730 [Leptolyngbyaceae cyanobacterium MO_188.B28]|nr:hypothetical protein [Leptolyngbyaceae cyanobacterium MO_188.B28]
MSGVRVLQDALNLLKQFLLKVHRQRQLFCAKAAGPWVELLFRELYVLIVWDRFALDDSLYGNSTQLSC